MAACNMVALVHIDFPISREFTKSLDVIVVDRVHHPLYLSSSPAPAFVNPDNHTVGSAGSLEGKGITTANNNGPMGLFASGSNKEVLPKANEDNAHGTCMYNNAPPTKASQYEVRRKRPPPPRPSPQTLIEDIKTSDDAFQTALTGSSSATASEYTGQTLIAMWMDQGKLNLVDIDWPPPRHGRCLTTRSLALVDDFTRPFLGPLPYWMLHEMYRQKRGLVDVCEGSVSAHIHDPPAYPRFGTVVVGDMRLQGRAWTVFDAHAGGHDLVAKFYVPRIGGWTRLGDVRREIWLYDHVLRGLQGTVVPRWYGVYGAQQPLKPQGGMGDMVEVYVALTKDAGVPMTGDELRELTEEDNLTHWLKPPGAPISQLRLVDFGLAVIRPSLTSELAQVTLPTGSFDDEAEEEMLEVREMLGLGR
ncbi:uncharacterized protein EHS24_006482 [Apiotrichum porosum]|uniref:Protein kinase domain-containing protein n=1 Tax=Apiotrichum porosum TaxID=105984 RepID=A0A427Y1A1_9TREE|nr:uncharacterized protein EHS24_006482 [Apiotrichum porosum]RSH84934.1 hypothetical protein EHS24_006482 [Apiotrichum porosum]